MSRRGRKPVPRAGTLRNTAVGALPRCPDHLSDAAKKEWRRLATPLHRAGLLSLADRAALAAYCQAWARWVEAEEKLAGTPTLLKTPSGYVQQSPWLTVANKQLELMGRYMTELGLTPVARTRLDMPLGAQHAPVDKIEVVIVGVDEDGNRFDKPLLGGQPRERDKPSDNPVTITVNEDL
ncbi:phage terminase, small subunit, putative, P27 family [Lutimaribacter pacificus]|uniref:Phage terminase, small subunit, putative, P27 family n=1 Tax=Lutimaribacter pacificus TaxID=391948 RepID=A0A1H0ID34_9RHOB|nr:phage terminase small subunit P27 family [Lutimaribacter pacificus]SDO28991.1 phage terminase, small subunit, putative, P27 family [Lutimaribacter pacificus]SHK23663.1 phage terminase, small subunit, putative, P27 family [Lutimaribacter pacificus]